MNHELSLRLELVEQTADALRFSLSVRNRSDAKVLLPYPEIHGLRFNNLSTTKEADWSTCLMVSGSWRGFTLSPGEEKLIEYRVRPSDVPSPDDSSDYYRWCVDLPQGEYHVWFQLDVNDKYFCGDSHYEYEDLVREAGAAEAVVWRGEVQSNRLNLVRVQRDEQELPENR